MNGYLLCILPLFTLPNMVMAITCYTCTPNPPTLACTTVGDLNVTDCDADPNIPSGMANVCTKVLTIFKMGQMGQMNANEFSCGMKAMCHDFQAKACNASQLPPGMTYEKCEATCCEQNKCNGLGNSTSASPSRPATSVPVQPTSVSAKGTPPKPTSVSATETPTKHTSVSATETPPKHTSVSVTETPPKPTSVSATGTPPKPTSGATAYNKVVSLATIFTSALSFVY